MAYGRLKPSLGISVLALEVAHAKKVGNAFGKLAEQGNTNQATVVVSLKASYQRTSIIIN